MNEQNDFERLVADQLSSAAVGAPPKAAIEDTITRARGSRRLPEWLALIKESPMRMNSHVAVGSPTVRVVAVMVATFLLALALAAAGASVQRLLAAGPIIVAQDGSGDYTTITAAVAAASDGDEVRVRTGTYVESVLIDKDITVTGDGDRSQIVLDHTIASPTIAGPAGLGYTELQYGLLIDGVDAEVRDLTLLARGVAVAIDGGAPLLEGLLIDDPVETDVSGEAIGEEPDLWESGAIVVEGGARPLIRDVTTDGWIWVGAASPELTQNRIANYIYLGEGSESTIRDNEVAHVNAWRASVRGVIDGNTFGGSPWPEERSKAIELATAEDSAVEIVRNTIRHESYDQGIRLSGGGTVSVIDNSVAEAATGLRFDVGNAIDLVMTGNEFSGGDWGVVIADHAGTAVLADNTITGNGTGLFLNGASDNSFDSNRICDNEKNVMLAVGAEAPDPATNEVCEDAAA